MGTERITRVVLPILKATLNDVGHDSDQIWDGISVTVIEYNTVIVYQSRLFAHKPSVAD